MQPTYTGVGLCQVHNPGIIAVMGRASIVLVFLFSGVTKVLHPLKFEESIATYGLLNPSITHAMAIGLPILEIICAFLVLTGFHFRVGILGIVIMLSFFVIALLSVIVRGLPIDCGCFGESAWLNASPWTALVRDLLLSLLAGYLYIERVRVDAERIRNEMLASSGTP